MGLASLILGIAAVVIALVPCLNIILTPILAIVGIVLGVVDLVNRNKTGQPKGQPIAGIALSAGSFVVLGVMSLILAIIGAAGAEAGREWEFEMQRSFEQQMENAQREMSAHLEQMEAEQNQDWPAE